MKTSKLLHQAIYDNGKLICNYNENPVLNTLAYGVEFQDDTVKRYGAKIIAEKI